MIYDDDEDSGSLHDDDWSEGDDKEMDEMRDSDAGDISDDEADDKGDKGDGQESDAQDDKATKAADDDKGGDKVGDGKDKNLTAKEAVKAEAEKDNKQEKHWAINAMHEERLKRQDLQATVNRMEGRFQQLQDKVNKEDEQEGVDFNENPALNLQARMDKMEDSLEKTGMTEEQIAGRNAQATAVENFKNEFAQVEAEYEKEAPDYQAAIDFLRDARITEYKLTGIPAMQAEKMAINDAFAIATNAKQIGENGAEMFYKLALSRGYVKGDKKEEPDDKKDLTELEKLKEIADNIEKSQGLGTGGDSPTAMSLAELANLDDKDFDKATEGDNWKKVAGG